MNRRLSFKYVLYGEIYSGEHMGIYALDPRKVKKNEKVPIYPAIQVEARNMVEVGEVLKERFGVTLKKNCKGIWNLLYNNSNTCIGYMDIIRNMGDLEKTVMNFNVDTQKHKTRQTFTYIIQGEIYRGAYQGMYKANRQGMEAIFNMGVKDAIKIEANNLTELKQIFMNKGLELKGRTLKDTWKVLDSNSHEFLGELNISRR